MSSINTLREHLFATLQDLRAKDNPMDIERAKVVCEVGQVIINSAKAEIDFLKANGSVKTEFFERPALPGAAPAPQLGNQPEGHQDEDLDTEVGGGKREIATGSVSVDFRNGRRIVTHSSK